MTAVELTSSCSSSHGSPFIHFEVQLVLVPLRASPQAVCNRPSLVCRSWDMGSATRYARVTCNRLTSSLSIGCYEEGPLIFACLVFTVPARLNGRSFLVSYCPEQVASPVLSRLCGACLTTWVVQCPACLLPSAVWFCVEGPDAPPLPINHSVRDSHGRCCVFHGCRHHRPHAGLQGHLPGE